MTPMTQARGNWRRNSAIRTSPWHPCAGRQWQRRRFSWRCLTSALKSTSLARRSAYVRIAASGPWSRTLNGIAQGRGSRPSCREPYIVNMPSLRSQKIGLVHGIKPAHFQSCLAITGAESWLLPREKWRPKTWRALGVGAARAACGGTVGLWRHPFPPRSRRLCGDVLCRDRCVRNMLRELLKSTATTCMKQRWQRKPRTRGTW